MSSEPPLSLSDKIPTEPDPPGSNAGSLPCHPPFSRPFPPELHPHIAVHADRKSLYACCLVNRRFLEVYGQALYTHVSVQGVEALYKLLAPRVSLKPARRPTVPLGVPYTNLPFHWFM